MKHFWITTAALMMAAAPVVSAADQDDELVREQLNETREEIRELSERLAELSLQLVDGQMQELQERHMASHLSMKGPSIGAVIQSGSGKRGVEVMAVTPDGPAERAGLQSGDVILGMNDVRFDDVDFGAGQKLTDFMSGVTEGDSIDVDLERDGRAMSLRLEPRELNDAKVFSFALEDGVDFDPFVFINEDMMDMAVEVGESFEFIFADGPWADMEVVALTPGLGDYFGVSDGLLVVRAPKDGTLDVREGDVIVRVDGNALNDRRALSRSLARRNRDETVRFEIVRQRQSMTIEAVVPEHKGHFGEDAEVFIQRFAN